MEWQPRFVRRSMHALDINGVIERESSAGNLACSSVCTEA